MKTRTALILASAVLMATTGITLADVSQTMVKYVSAGAGMELTVQHPFTTSGDTFEVGVINLKIDNPDGQPAFDLPGFCIDIKQNASDTWKPYDLSNDLGIAPQDGGSIYEAMGSTKANYIRELWFNEFDNARYDDTNAAAFQSAIWEIIYEDGPNSWDLSGGNLSISDSNVANIANNWLAALDGFDLAGQLAALTNDDGETRWQDYIYDRGMEKIVPEPVTIISLTMGLSGLSMYMRKRRLA